MANGVINHDRVSAQSGSDGQFLDPAGELGKQGTLGRQRPDMQGMESSLIHIHRQLDAGALWQVGDQAAVKHVAVEFERLAALKGIDDIGSILLPTLQITTRDLFSELDPYAIFPGRLGLLVFLQDVGVFTGIMLQYYCHLLACNCCL